MKRALLLMLLLSLAIFSAKTQNCSSFPPATVCSQSPQGHRANCCRCLGTNPKNQAFCSRTPTNKALIALLISGLAIDQSC
jgi:hypothetical protein